jgi:multiple sugar transport system permease protein
VRRRRRTATVLYACAGVLLALVILIPFLFALSASLQTESELIRRPPPIVAPHPTIDNYNYIFTGKVPRAYASKELLRGTVTKDARQIPKGLRNSFIVAIGTVLINLIFATLASYTFARERFRGRQTAYFFVLGSRLLPGVAVAVPIYVILRNLGLLDSKLGLVLIYSAFTLPFSIWVLTLYFRSLPAEIEEAARVDGCTRLEALRHVVLPLAAPGLAAIGAFSFLFSYSEFLFALFTTETPHSKTIPVIIASVSVNPDASYTLIAVGIVLSMIAPILFALAFRRYITSGLVASLTRA